MIEDALAGAGVAPADVDYLEAHGTGSQIGDPIEVHAAAAAYGKGREAGRPLLIGTVKASIGHLEAAAGMAGLIKVVLAMRNGTIPKQLHFATPNPHVDWDQLPVRVASEATEWPMHADRPARAGVSAFGVSGTNAHVIVEGCEARDIRLTPRRCADSRLPSRCLRRSPNRLRTATPAAHAGCGPCRCPASLPTRSSRWLGSTFPGLIRELTRWHLTLPLRRRFFPTWPGQPALAGAIWLAARESCSQTPRRSGKACTPLHEATLRHDRAERRRLRSSIPGLGGAWAALGESLYEAEPVVRAVLDRCDAVISAERGKSLKDRMFGHADPPDDPDDLAWTRPTAYAMQCALTALWSSVGIEASAVVGIDIGELAAAEAAGMIGLEDGLLLAAAGSAPVERLQSDMAMAPPTRAVISGITGKEIQRAGVPDFQESIGRERQAPPLECIARTLSHRGIGAIVEVGPGSSLGTEIAGAWPDKAAGMKGCRP